MKIRIDIQFIDFNSEWHGEVRINGETYKHLASSTLYYLLSYIRKEIVKYQKEMTEK